MSTEALYRRQRELVRNLFRFLNQAHEKGDMFERVEAFGGEGVNDDGHMLRWTGGIFRRLKDENAIEMVGTKFRPRYKALTSWGEITEDLISDYATTTNNGEPAYTRRMAPQMPTTPPAVRFGRPVDAGDPEKQQEDPDEEGPPMPPIEKAPTSGVVEGEPSTEEMLKAFFQLLPHLIPAINRIEKLLTEQGKRQVEIDRKLTKIYADLVGSSNGK